MAIIHPTTTSNIGIGFGPSGLSFYEDRTWHGVFYNNFHGGVDYWGPTDYPVVACANGVVLYAGSGVPYIGAAGGTGVVISHGPYMKSIYGHLNSITVGAGQAVVSGQKIGGIGQSGVANGVTHLHFEIRTITTAWGEDVEDPNEFLPGGALANSAQGNDTSDIPWLEPITGTVIKAALCNPIGTNMWATPTAATSIVAVYVDRMLLTSFSYTVDGNVITMVSDISSEVEVRADYTAG